MSVSTVTNDTKPKMEAVVEDFQRKLANIRTGRATVGLLDSVVVDYYGTPTPLNQMASVAVPEPQLLTVQPWDISQVNAVEKAIIAANLGMNPSNDGKIIRLPVPPLNEERRKQLAKQVGEIAEDDERSGLDEVQKLTNTFIARIDELTKNKEQEIMSV